METKNFKTNIKCMGCISAVTPVLNEKAGVDQWKVDLESADKTLSVPSGINSQELVEALNKAGYIAEPN